MQMFPCPMFWTLKNEAENLHSIRTQKRSTNFISFFDLEASSQKSTVCRLKKVDDVQELIQLMYILSVSSCLQKKVKAGGGVSEKGKLSASSLRKHVCPRYRPLIAQSMVCGDCHQRKKSIAVLNSALDTDSSVFMSRTESRSIEIAIGSLESVENFCRERKVDGKGRDINVKSVIREYRKLEGTQYRYAQKLFLSIWGNRCEKTA